MVLVVEADQDCKGPGLVGPRRSSQVRSVRDALLLEVIKTLFPAQDDIAPGQTRTTSWTVEWEDKWQVTSEELLEMTRKMAFCDVTPDPDRLSGRIWVKIVRVMASKLRRLYTRCLKEGVYSRA